MSWTVESLERWGREQELRSRRLAQGVMFQRRGQRNTAFSIYLAGLETGFAAEIAFNPKDDVATQALECLTDVLTAAAPKSGWKWPRLGLTTHDDAVLTTLMARIRNAAPAPGHRASGDNDSGDPGPNARVVVDPKASRTFKRKPSSMAGLENLGRVRLSPSFFLRDFLYSEIAAVRGLSNIPDHPDVAIAAGQGLCEHLLEPLQARFGRIAIRSAYRSSEVNTFGNENKLNCSSNAHSYGRHIWDHPDERGHLGATACIVVPAFIDYYERTGHWEALAWWVHDHLPYSRMEFYPQLAAFNLTWSEQPEGRIASRTPLRLGILTKRGMDNFEGDHADEYGRWLDSTSI